MITISRRNVNENYAESLRIIKLLGVQDNSRNGPVLVVDSPMMTVTLNPTERVLFDESRDANPFFHFFECLWMMAGRDDGEFLDMFVRDFSSRYAEDGGVIHGAYGARWRNHFGVDQISECVSALSENTKDRRAVIAMWDPATDLGVDVRDVPCNTHIYPRVRRDMQRGCDVLDITVCCRSNDIIWGATGANAVHFSFLQEYMAGMIGVGVGTMYQLSNNWHAYPDTLERVGQPDNQMLYEAGAVATYPIVRDAETWDAELDHFLDNMNTRQYFRNTFFSEVAYPMWRTHQMWRAGDRVSAMTLAGEIAAPDWQYAVIRWMQRRVQK